MDQLAVTDALFSQHIGQPLLQRLEFRAQKARLQPGKHLLNGQERKHFLGENHKPGNSLSL